VEGLFDLAVLWQAGFRNTTCAIGTQLTPAQLAQLCDSRDRSVAIAFDHDDNQAGQKAAQALGQSLQQAGLCVRLVDLLDGHDPNSYQSEIHHPTDNTLLADTVRVVTRLVKRLGEIVARAVRSFHNRSRAAKRRSQQIQRMTSRERQTQQTGKYRELIEITQEVVQSARGVLAKSQGATLLDVLEAAKLQALRQQIEHHCQLGEQVIDQSRRRVLEGEKAPNAAKLFSLFETHTDLIRRGKVLTPEEFGHKVFLAESEQGLITQYEVLVGNPHDQDHVEVSLETESNPSHFELDRAGCFNRHIGSELSPAYVLKRWRG
jgi:IS5 family transposase